MQLALADLRGDVGDDVVLMADLCVDEYTDHGHCGVLDGTASVDNDATLEIYAKAARRPGPGRRARRRPERDDGRPGRRDPRRARRRGLRRRGDPRLLGQVRERAVRPVPRRRRRRRSSAAATARATSRTGATPARRCVEVEADIAQGADMVMVKPALAYLDVIAAVRDARRRAGRRVPRQRRVLDDQGGGGQRLDRPRRRRPRAPHGDQAGRRRHHPHLPRPVVRRGSRARHDGDRGSSRSAPPACVGAGCDPDGVHRRRRAVERRRCSSAPSAAIPGGVNSSIRAFKVGRRHAVPRGPRRGARTCGTSRAPATSTSSRATAR